MSRSDTAEGGLAALIAALESRAPQLVLDRGEEARDHAARDWWPFGLMRAGRGRDDFAVQPAAVARPSDAREVAILLELAGEHGIPVVPQGGRSGVAGGAAVPRGGIALELGRMNSVVAVDPHDRLVEVEAGCRMADLETAVAEHGFTTGHAPQSIELAQVGGLIATRSSGQLATKYGNIEDRVAGLELVMPDGLVVRRQPVPRRSVGPEATDLAIGSEGSLGVVTRAWLWLCEAPAVRRAGAAGLDDIESGWELVRRIVQSGARPSVLRLYQAAVGSGPLGKEAKNTAEDWLGPQRCFFIWFTEGDERLADAEASLIESLVAEAGATDLGPGPAWAWHRHRNDLAKFEAAVDRGATLETIEVAGRWSTIPDLYRSMLDAVSGLPGLSWLDCRTPQVYPHGTCLYFTVVLDPMDDADAEADRYEELWERGMAAAAEAGATLAHHHGIGRLRTPWMEVEHGAGGLELLRRVRRAADPRGTLNPGVLLPDGERRALDGWRRLGDSQG